MIKAISPIDGRYASKTASLQDYFSEFALIRYRVKVEVLYFKALVKLRLAPLAGVTESQLDELDILWQGFSTEDAQSIKDIERTTNHDVKAVEYFIKSKMDALGLKPYEEFIHFGLTSQDVNNTALPMMMQDAWQEVIHPVLLEVIQDIKDHAMAYRGMAMLARTHGQPASPTTMGKEWMVFVERLEDELETMSHIRLKAKFGGATGNFNAHVVSFPEVDWKHFADTFVGKYLGLRRAQYTTQIAHYDDVAAFCQGLSRIHTILLDFCKDIWAYISMDYFKQKVVANEVGSSAMPHKVNPIDFENAEGNLGLANAVLHHLAEKLPISRLQRDLTDSTVIRNVGVPLAHGLIAYNSIIKGLSKLLINKTALDADLEANWAVVAEAIQNILRREGYPKPYEALKALTRGKTTIKADDIREFVLALNVSESIKSELLAITPHNYIGYQ